MKKLSPFIIILSILCFAACEKTGNYGPDQVKTPELPESPFEYMTDNVKQQLNFGNFNPAGTFTVDDFNNISIANSFFVPSNLVSRAVTGIAQNDLSDESATLGRVLFYDTQLSVNNAISCGSCHQQSRGFADGLKLTPGFKGDDTDRHTISIANTMSQDGFFWDNNVAFLEDQVLNPVQNHKEMGMEDLSLLPGKLATTSYYGELFEKAYGNREISNEKISEALTQFMISMVSDGSKFSKFADEIMSGVDEQHAGLSSLELAGFQVFNSEAFQCASCHKLPKIAARSIADTGSPYETSEVTFISETKTQGPGSNIGLDSKNVDAGNGTNGFKIPSLINVGLTGPYMHDGRFSSLEEVLDHYSHGVKDNPNLDSRLRTNNGNPVRMNFTEFERQALVAFLHTLSDQEYLADEKFSDPFSD